MSVSGNPVAMYTPSNGQAHIFYRGDGDSRQGFVIEHVFWGEEYYNQPYVPKSESSGSALTLPTYRRRAPRRH
jgi:hypothetical protein